jgi:hypothetical protein
VILKVKSKKHLVELALKSHKNRTNPRTLNDFKKKLKKNHIKLFYNMFCAIFATSYDKVFDSFLF